MGHHLVKTIPGFAHLQERVSTMLCVVTPAGRLELCEGGADYPLVVRRTQQVGPGGLPEARGVPDESRNLKRGRRLPMRRTGGDSVSCGRCFRAVRPGRRYGRLSAYLHGGCGTTAGSPTASCTVAPPATSATEPSTSASASRRTPAAPPRGPRSARPPRGSRRRSPRPARWADRGPGGSPSWCPTPRAGRW